MKLQFVAKILDVLAPLNNCQHRTINPRALEFVLHYISGSKKPKTLTPDEIEHTKYLIVNTASQARYFYTDGVTQNIADIYKDPDVLAAPNFMVAFYSGKTAGLVGGFDYTFDHNTMLAHCEDTWNFNDSQFTITLNFPTWMNKIVRKWLGRYNLQKHVRFVHGNNSSRLEVIEDKLRELNGNHEFKTNWVVDFTGACCSLGDAPVYDNSILDELFED